MRVGHAGESTRAFTSGTWCGCRHERGPRRTKIIFHELIGQKKVEQDVGAVGVGAGMLCAAAALCRRTSASKRGGLRVMSQLPLPTLAVSGTPHIAGPPPAPVQRCGGASCSTRASHVRAAQHTRACPCSDPTHTHTHTHTQTHRRGAQAAATRAAVPRPGGHLQHGHELGV